MWQLQRGPARWGWTLTLTLALGLVLAGVARAEDPRIGIIDSQRIFSEYQEAADAEAIFQEEMQGWQQEMAEMESAILEKQEQIRSQALLLSKEKLDELQAQLDQDLQTYEARKAELFDPNRGKAVQRNQELSQPINDQITTVVERLGAEKGFDLILDVATVNVVYMAEGVDLTDAVLEALEKAGN